MRTAPPPLLPADVEAIERATLAAVPPQATEELRGWLLAFDDGTVGRAHSAVPLRHESAAPGLLADIGPRYAARSLQPVLRVPRLPVYDGLRVQLVDAGWHGGKPTRVQVAQAAEVASCAMSVPVELAGRTSDEWDALMLGEGFDPVDGKSRLAILRRAQSSLFASVRVDGRLAAVGTACYSHGWASVHGMRTAPAFRGRGLAGSIIARFGQEAQARGITRMFLQVEETNPAQSIYRRAGFADAWIYEYWKPGR